MTSIDIPTISSPSSTRTGLPPRPCSAGFRSSMRNMLPQRSFCPKTSLQDGEKTYLIFSHTPKSDIPVDKPSTSRSFSLNKVFSSPSTKRACSLPVTPIANSGTESGCESDANPVTEDYVSVSVTVLVFLFELGRFCFCYYLVFYRSLES